LRAARAGDEDAAGGASGASHGPSSAHCGPVATRLSRSTPCWA